VRIIRLILFAVALSGCATSYQPKGLTGGYSETQLNPNIFRVSFSGNGFTGAEKAADLALLRSAEITLNSGFTHFVIIDGNSTESLYAYTTPAQSYTTANATAYGNYAYGTANTTTYGGQTFIASKPKSTNTIMCFKGKPDYQGLVYDAKFVCESVGSKYDVICNSMTSNEDLNSATATMDCQTSEDCKEGKSCRSKKMGGTECR